MSEEIVAWVDPDALEREVIRLREECRRVVDELQRRYDRLVHLPARLRAAGLRVPRAVARAVRAHPVIAVASLAAVVALAVWLERRR